MLNGRLWNTMLTNPLVSYDLCFGDPISHLLLLLHGVLIGLKCESAGCWLLIVNLQTPFVSSSTCCCVGAVVLANNVAMLWYLYILIGYVMASWPALTALYLFILPLSLLPVAANTAVVLSRYMDILTKFFVEEDKERMVLISSSTSTNFVSSYSKLRF